MALTSPTNGAVYIPYSDIPLTASATASNTTVVRVQYYAGSTLIGVASNSPYLAVWPSVVPGTYTLTAVATARSGIYATSASVVMRVGPAPQVAIATPPSGSSFTAPTNIWVGAWLTNFNSTVSVSFYVNTNLLGIASSSPYHVLWQNPAAGTYALTAIATDSGGAYAASSAITVTVSAATNSGPCDGAYAQLSNGSFEDGLNDWSYNDYVYSVGVPPDQPIGVDGNYAADIGGGDGAGAMMWQTVAVASGSLYELTFFSASSGDAGRLSMGRAEIVDSDGNVIATTAFTNAAPSSVVGANGFEERILRFRPACGCVTIRFADITPDGNAVDLLIDKVELNQVTETPSFDAFADISNGSFESGLTDWSYNHNVYYVGVPPTQPIGVAGDYAGDVGGGDVMGAAMWQTVAVTSGALYELTFFSAASGDEGRVSVGRVDIADSDGNFIAIDTFTNVAPSSIVGANGFEERIVRFRPISDCVTIRFVDATPNGNQVDFLVDKVELNQVSANGWTNAFGDISNGSFESGLADWSYNHNVYYVGEPSTQPIGVDGDYAGDVGGGDAMGAMMWQSVAVTPGALYELTFFSAANGDEGRVSVGRVDIADTNGNFVAINTFTNIAPSSMLGANGFEERIVRFRPMSGFVTVRFVDATPNGNQVDLLVDKVELNQVPATSCTNAFAAISNGSFESGLADWSYNHNVYYVGVPPTQPIGVDGNYAGDVGGGDAMGAMMWQTVAVTSGALYELTFFSAANGDEGRVSVGRVDIADSNGNFIAIDTFTNIAPSSILGTNGFVEQIVRFRPTSDCVTIRFVDATANGNQVDLLVDEVALAVVTEE